MTVTIEDFHPLTRAAEHGRLVIEGATGEARQNVHVYVETPADGRQSANLPAVSDAHGRWRVEVAGAYAPGTEIRAYARGGSAPLAIKSVTL